MSYVISLINTAAVFGACAALQAVLLNRLGLAFAAVPAFLGLGCYLSATRDDPALSLGLAAAATASAVLVTWLADRLARDEYLLASLALLECLGATIGLVPGLGGRVGLPHPDPGSLGGPDFEVRMLPWTLTALLASCLVARGVLGSALGIAVDRIREAPAMVDQWLPVAKVRATLVGLVSVGALLLGPLYLAYQGRVGPQVFSIEFAIRLLTFTVLAGRWPELGAVSALAYWVFPYVATQYLDLSTRGAEDLVRILWGVLVVVVAMRAARQVRR